MALTFREWLKGKFDKLMSVQNASLNSNYADIVVHFWSGSRIRVHMIGQATSARALKRTLADATQNGINTLFIVDARILPEDNARAQPKEWMMALHTLNDDRIYAYRVQDGKPEIIPVHMEQINSGNDYKIWYGPKVTFDRLRRYRKSVRPRAIRGEWLVADFGAPAFWKNMDFRAARAKQERTQHFNTHWHDWSTFQTWRGRYESDEGETAEQRPPRSSGSIGDYLSACYNLLGVSRGASQEDVKKAYRKRAMVYHPDTSTLPAEEAEVKFKALTAAYEYIKSANGWS